MRCPNPPHDPEETHQPPQPHNIPVFSISWPYLSNRLHGNGFIFLSLCPFSEGQHAPHSIFTKQMQSGLPFVFQNFLQVNQSPGFLSHQNFWFCNHKSCRPSGRSMPSLRGCEATNLSWSDECLPEDPLVATVPAHRSWTWPIQVTCPQWKKMCFSSFLCRIIKVFFVISFLICIFQD